MAASLPANAGAAYLSSTNRHTLTLLRQALDDGGVASSLDGSMLRFDAHDADATVLALRTALTPVEADEVRLFFSTGAQPTITEALESRTLAAVAAQIRHAPLLGLLDDESAFYSHYQPIVDIVTGEPVAFEALLRADLAGERVMPADLFSAAEESGRIHVLDRIGRESALRGAGGWLGDRSLFINFLPTSIYRPEVCLRTTMRAAQAAQIDPQRLVFEVVESHAVKDASHLLSILDFYRDRGCRVALDDVGAGYSSLNLMAAIRPDVVKIDKELVQGLPDPASAAVVRAICSLAAELGAIVIAECVETAEQAAAARDLGATWAQGWYYGRPAAPPVGAGTHVSDVPVR